MGTVTRLLSKQLLCPQVLTEGYDAPFMYPMQDQITNDPELFVYLIECFFPSIRRQLKAVLKELQNHSELPGFCLYS